MAEGKIGSVEACRQDFEPSIKIDEVRGSFLEISSYPAEPTRNGVGTSRRLFESGFKNETFKEGEICVVGPVLATKSP